jgi:hypothetical protein
MGIHNGLETHHHDHVITFPNFSPRKSRNNKSGNNDDCVLVVFNSLLLLILGHQITYIYLLPVLPNKIYK